MSEALKPSAWMHPDGRVVPASTMDTARRDGGATLSSLSGYTVPLYAGAEIERLRAAHDHQYNMAGLMLREAERNSRQRDELLRAAESVLGEFDEGRLTADDRYYLSDRRAITDLRAAIDAANGEDAARQVGEAFGRAFPGNAAKEHAGWRYYYRSANCKAKNEGGADCICWHNEGEGPLPDARHDDAGTPLQWRGSDQRDAMKEQR